jgi:hypothetical protein
MVSKRELDIIQRLGRQYSKHLRTAAATMFRTQNPYHDSLLGMWKVPTRGDPLPTEDTLFQLDPEESLRRLGTDPPMSVAD